MDQLNSGIKIKLILNLNRKSSRGLVPFLRNSKKMRREKGVKRKREGMSRSGERSRKG